MTTTIVDSSLTGSPVVIQYGPPPDPPLRIQGHDMGDLEGGAGYGIGRGQYFYGPSVIVQPGMLEDDFDD
jgi:hypothetical protein